MLCFISVGLFAQTSNEDSHKQNNSHEKLIINDGPYVFIEENKLIEKTIVDGEVFVKNLSLNTYDLIYKPEGSIYKNVNKVAALSDIHGQFDLAVEILKNNKIIDDELKWIYGDGHLVIVGDVFDRGHKVTEVLWLLYNLENQAESKGGKVHYLLGNHEYMVLHNDLRYINKKYEAVSKLLETNYRELFSDKTVLGKWLRSKATMVKINNDIYVHGGISEDFISVGFEIETINKKMREAIDLDKEQMKTTSFYNDFFGAKGPIWYRGYFYDNMKDQEIIDILKKTNSKHIIVGHCSNKKVVQLYNNKIFGVDSSIKNGKYGEILLIEKEFYNRGTMKGTKLSFD